MTEDLLVILELRFVCVHDKKLLKLTKKYLRRRKGPDSLTTDAWPAASALVSHLV